MRARFPVESLPVELADKITILGGHENPPRHAGFAGDREFEHFRTFEYRCPVGISEGSGARPLTQVFGLPECDIFVVALLGFHRGRGRPRFLAGIAVVDSHHPFLLCWIPENLGIAPSVLHHWIFWQFCKTEAAILAVRETFAARRAREGHEKRVFAEFRRIAMIQKAGARKCHVLRCTLEQRNGLLLPRREINTLKMPPVFVS